MVRNVGLFLWETIKMKGLYGMSLYDKNGNKTLRLIPIGEIP